MLNNKQPQQSPDVLQQLQPTNIIPGSTVSTGGLPSEIPTDEKTRLDFNLSEGEGLLCIIERHPIGKIVFYISTTVGVMVVLASLFLFTANKAAIGMSGIPDVVPIVAGVFIILALAAVNMINVKIYNLNRLILTTESVIVEGQQGIFDKHRKTINLESIEDVSYDQKGIFPQLLGYATLKIATVGRDSTVFTLTKNAKKYANYIENAREQLLQKQRLEQRG